MNQQLFDDSTLIRIFALHELHNLKDRGLTRGALLDYHSRYKLVFLAHSQPEYRKLGPFVADIHQWQNLDDYYNQYRQRVIVLLSHPANRRDHTNVLMHVQGYFRPHIDSTERQQLAALIDSYRRGEQPLLAPLMRIKHYMALYPDACRNSSVRVLALYIATPRQWAAHNMSPRQAEFINAQLNGLQIALAEKGIPLLFHEVDDFAASVEIVKQVCAENRVTHLFYNYQYEVNERARDVQAERALRNVVCEGFDDGVILPPGAVMTGNHEMYKVFTPFKNAWLKRLREGMPECVAAPKVRSSGSIDPAPSITLNYPRQPFDTAHFPVEEKAAIAQLRQFCQNGAGEYEQQRDFPAVEGTSRLSASLATGGLSPRQCLHRLLAEQPQALDGGAGSIWLNELIWREFYRHLITYYPSLCKHRPFIVWTDRVQWQSNSAHLKAWQEGKTGYPIVDAAMRQLNSTGWMHNRLRMITASFLVKDLLIDWREGERYFMSQLIDGDLAANNGGWQWAASTGTDAAPYFRIFNPTTQGEKFDREGEFIRQWLPELRDVPGKVVHEPWKWAQKAGVTLDYPQPIVDHKEARLRTLAAYEEARKGA
ncbi:TPA: deoxyribodipyrimidine photo-lyase [Escherichia coli]|nr:deoxyribodipyrimidine photo-lyase [Escherichia coli]